MQTNKVMLNNSHKSIICILRDAVEQWRKQNGWSRESLVQNIVEAHEACLLDVSSGIKFDPATRDPYERMKVNADRVYRWLDEVTKDRNLLPANFIPSVLMAMPIKLRIATANQMLVQVGLSCRGLNSTGNQRSAFEMLQRLLSECADAQTSIAALIDGETQAELEQAHKEITEAMEALIDAQHQVEARLNALKAGGQSVSS